MEIRVTISKEKAEELRDKFLLRLQADLEKILHTTIDIMVLLNKLLSRILEH